MLEATYWKRNFGMFPMYIYKLTDPRGGDICYVGKSRNPLQRVRHHLAYASNLSSNTRLKEWLLDLKQNGLRPRLTLLDTCVAEESNQAELDCIAAIRAVRESACLNIESARERRV